MKLFVTGICGRLGRALAAESASHDVTIVGIDRVPWPGDEPLPVNVTTVVGSYDDLDLVRRLLPGCDAVAHLAGPNGGQLGDVDLAGFVHMNVTVLGQLLELTVEARVPAAVICSTMEVVIGRSWDARVARVIDEQTPPCPDSPYSLSRWLAERLGEYFALRHRLSVASLRFMAFGNARGTNLGLRGLARVLTAADAARAVIFAAKRRDLRGQAIHIGPDSPITDEDIAEARVAPMAVLERYWPGCTSVLEANAMAPTWNHFWPKTRIDRARQLLGWMPRDTFHAWLSHARTAPQDASSQGSSSVQSSSVPSA